MEADWFRRILASDNLKENVRCHNFSENAEGCRTQQRIKKAHRCNIFKYVYNSGGEKKVR
jgi:hypothetical protein